MRPTCRRTHNHGFFLLSFFAAPSSLNGAAITTGEKHNISTNNRLTKAYYYRLNQIIVTAEADRNKPCRSFTYLLVDW